MEGQHDEQLSLLLAHLEELCDRAAGGSFTCSAYLTPREAKHALRMLRHHPEGHRVRAWGGYPSAERVCLLFFPDYVIDLVGEEAFSDTPVPELLEMAGEDDPVTPLLIRGSGYRTMTHRDLLGSLLSLGLEREVIGDIAPDPTGHSAVIFTTPRIKPFLLSDLERVGGDAVKVFSTTLPRGFDGDRRYAPLRDTIASPRLDCILAALCNLSRDDAKTAILAGLVELDYDCETRPDREVTPPAVISMRGKGKFALRSIGAPTKKGRLPITADKYL